MAKETKKNEEAEIKEEAVKEEQSELENVKKELEEKNSQFLRLAAEYDNFRKRSQREREGLYSDAKVNVITEILPVIDNLERALQHSGDVDADFKKGVEMTYTQLKDVLKKLGVEESGTVGETFDPNFHNAVMHVDDESLEENVIAEVFAKGYRLGDKVLRAAMVKVAN